MITGGVSWVPLEAVIMATGIDFQEWLEKRAQEVNQPERLRHRSEWIAALD
jgi:hypothetical protein